MYVGRKKGTERLKNRYLDVLDMKKSAVSKENVRYPVKWNLSTWATQIIG